jgi:uncharacterized protein YjbJ (UPF0337 family)
MARMLLSNSTRKEATMPGRMDELKGSAKESLGKLVGNERLEAEGGAQKTAGKVERESKGLGNQVAGNAKMAAGKVTGDERLHAEGQAQDVEGRLQSAG